MAQSLTLEIPFIPVPYVRMTQKGKFVRPEAKRYLASKAAVAWEMKIGLKDREPFANGIPLKVRIIFECKKVNHRQDCDNLIKATLDSGNGILWTDDRWVDEISARRIQSPAGDRTIIVVEEI